jgi:serine/threonine protein phosphatase 1
MTDNDASRVDAEPGRVLVLGDVHGAHKALVQVLERAAFDRSRDRLIFLGDVVDGWPETRECVDELLTIPNLVHLLGNHDVWVRDALSGRHPGYLWLAQGGQATVDSYGKTGAPREHKAYLASAKLWHQEGDRIFVHGGWPLRYPHPRFCGEDEVTWDRDLWNAALEKGEGKLTAFAEVYVGHTTTTRAGFTEPVQKCEVWNMDQGAGYEGRLSLMDVDTKEVWQSDPVGDLYPNHHGSGRTRTAA